MTRIIFDEKYCGFESYNDLIAEIEYGDFFPEDIPGEYQGTLRVVITYEDFDEEK